ncbi:MAG: NAD(P)H-dependent glycerol-3-phosphate dehydrogenase [Gemmatimonadaceae bacterium]
MRCVVVGGGAWGTALAHVLGTNGHEVMLWAREPEVVAAVNARHENTMFLAGAPLSPAVKATADMAAAIRGATIVVYAAPSSHLRTIARSANAYVGADAIIGVATKGIEEGTLALMTDVIAAEHPQRPVVAISGPSFAAEVVANQPTLIVAASEDAAGSHTVQQAFSNATFRVYTQRDVIGVELGGALKNVMAVATGIVEGVGLGFNSRAALITRGLAEMTRLGVALGATASTFAGLAGLGDLVLTCTGSLSRNRAIGEEIGRGASLAEALAGKQTVAEGVVTARSAAQLAAKHDVEMPIVQMVNRILFEGQTARRAVNEMMTRELRPEQDA